jgi:aryl-alcohol dehydrogenase-like predicted oxidoreductase
VSERSFVVSNIIGATSLTQLKENIGSYKIKLSEEILSEIDNIHSKIPNPAV